MRPDTVLAALCVISTEDVKDCEMAVNKIQDRNVRETTGEIS